MNFSFRGHYPIIITSLVTRKRGGLFVQLESSCIVGNEAGWVLKFILLGNPWILREWRGSLGEGQRSKVRRFVQKWLFRKPTGLLLRACNAAWERSPMRAKSYRDYRFDPSTFGPKAQQRQSLLHSANVCDWTPRPYASYLLLYNKLSPNRAA